MLSTRFSGSVHEFLAVIVVQNDAVALPTGLQISSINEMLIFKFQI